MWVLNLEKTNSIIVSCLKKLRFTNGWATGQSTPQGTCGSVITSAFKHWMWMQTTWEGEQRGSQDWPQNNNCLLAKDANTNALLPVFINFRQEQVCLILENQNSSWDTNFYQSVDPSDLLFPLMFNFAPRGPMKGIDTIPVQPHTL